jgi:AraC-like DNA-binding protein
MVEISSNISIATKKLDQYELTDFRAFFVGCPDDGLKGACREFALRHWRQLTVDTGVSFRSSVPVLAFEECPDEVDAIRATCIDMVLALIGRDLGHETARKIARALNRHTMEYGRDEVGDLVLNKRQKVCDSARWMRNNYSAPISVAHAAEYATMSERSYRRHFKSEFAITPLEYLLRTRFEAVCSMLKDTGLPIDKIARRSGMGDGNRLGRIFKARIGMTPTQYRAQVHMAGAVPSGQIFPKPAQLDPNGQYDATHADGGETDHGGVLLGGDLLIRSMYRRPPARRAFVGSSY